MAIFSSNSNIYKLGILSLLMMSGVGCAQRVEDDRSRTLTQKEIERIPNIEEQNPNNQPNSGERGGDGSFNIGELEQNAPMEIVNLGADSDRPSSGLGLRSYEAPIATVTVTSTASTTSTSQLPNPLPPIRVGSTSNSASFRDWYASSTEPEKSKYFAVSCKKVFEAGVAELPRIVLVRLKDVSQNPAATLETVAFQIRRCDEVGYALSGLLDNKLYVLESRIYDYFKGALDSGSSLFYTRLVLEGSAINVKKNSASQIEYRRTVDSSVASVDADIGEIGQSESDPLLGRNVKITVVRLDATGASKPVSNIDVTLIRESQLSRRVALKTDANGVASTTSLRVGYWSVNVKGMTADGLVYNPMISRIQVIANQDVNHEIKMQPQVYGWLFETTVSVQVGNLLGSYRVSAGINERPDAAGSHQGFALPAFLKYCSTSLTNTDTSLEGQIKNLIAIKLKEISARPTAAARDEGTKKFKYTTVNQSSKIESTSPDYLKTVGKQIAWDPIPTLAPFGASKPCTIN